MERGFDVLILIYAIVDYIDTGFPEYSSSNSGNFGSLRWNDNRSLSPRVREIKKIDGLLIHTQIAVLYIERST